MIKNKFFVGGFILILFMLGYFIQINNTDDIPNKLVEAEMRYTQLVYSEDRTIAIVFICYSSDFDDGANYISKLFSEGYEVDHQGFLYVGSIRSYTVFRKIGN